MQVLEQLCIGKRGKAELCEDGVFVNAHFAAVVDGCTSRLQLVPTQRSSGIIAKESILSCLSTLDPAATMEQAFHAMNASILSWYQSQGVEEAAYSNPAKRCSAYVSLVSRYHRQVWVLGDCQALVGSVLTTRHKAVDTLMEDVRALLVEHAMLQGQTVEYLLANPQVIQAKLEEFMQLQPAFQNSVLPSSYRYTVLDGFFSDYQHVQIVNLPDAPTIVVLASDGYPQLHPTLAATEEALELQLRQDPLMVSTFRATKPLIAGNLSFDDRSFLRIIV